MKIESSPKSYPYWVRPPDPQPMVDFPAAYFQAPVQRNEAVERRISHYKQPKSPDEITSTEVRRQIKERFGKDIDPDKTYLVSIHYDHRTHTPPYSGVIVQKISLTEAARLNQQDEPEFDGAKRSKEDGPFEIRASSRHTEKPNAFGIFPRPNESGFTSHYQGIYIEPATSSANTYDASNRVAISAADFKSMVWDNSYKKPYDEYLEGTWDSNSRHTYTQATTAAFLKAAHQQHHDGTLTDNDQRLAMGVAGLPIEKKYSDLNDNDLSQPYTANPNVKTKFLTFNGFKMRAFYAEDDYTGRILLYLPGRVPALKGFDSKLDMNRWLGGLLKNPQEAEKLKLYFRPQDRPTEFRSQGADARVDLFTKTLDSEISEDQQAKQLYWLEGGVFNGNVVQGNPFEELQQRTEADMKNATRFQFVLNRDVTAKTVLKYLNWASYALILLAPLGIAFPPLGYALTGASVGLGGAKLGVGIDSQINGRPGADALIADGARSTAQPLFTAGLAEAFTPISSSLKAFAFKP